MFVTTSSDEKTYEYKYQEGTQINKTKISMFIQKKIFKTNQKIAEKALASKIIGKAKRAEACKVKIDKMFVKSPNPDVI